WLSEMGFVAGRGTQRTGPVFLIATSAGEVGVDLDAEHMVCDLVSWERMVQRLGRVNRRGEGDALVTVFYESEPVPDKRAKTALDKSEDERSEKDLEAIAVYEASIEQLRDLKRPFEELLVTGEDGF